jgi:hypothetical protein
LLIVDICIYEKSLGHFLVDQVQVVPLLVILIIPGVYHSNALIDAFSRCSTNVESVILQRVKYQLEILFPIEELVECYDLQLLAEFTQNQYGAILFYTVGLRVFILCQELNDGLKSLVDSFCGDLASGLGQDSQAIGGPLDQFLIIARELLENEWHYLFNSVDDSSLPAYSRHFVDGQKSTEHVVLIFGVQHDFKLVEQVVVAIFLILRKVLLELFRGLSLLVFLFKVSDDPYELHILKSYLSVVS